MVRKFFAKMQERGIHACARRVADALCQEIIGSRRPPLAHYNTFLFDFHCAPC
jgi:hypothetical protein